MRQKLSKCQIIKVYKLKWCGEVEITRMLSILEQKVGLESQLSDKIPHNCGV